MAIEDQALSFMDLTDRAINASLARLAAEGEDEDSAEDAAEDAAEYEGKSKKARTIKALLSLIAEEDEDTEKAEEDAEEVEEDDEEIEGKSKKASLRRFAAARFAKKAEEAEEAVEEAEEAADVAEDAPEAKKKAALRRLARALRAAQRRRRHPRAALLCGRAPGARGRVLVRPLRAVCGRLPRGAAGRVAGRPDPARAKGAGPLL